MILPNDDRELLGSKLGAASTADLLDPIQSERLERIARVMAQTRETFGDDDAGIVSFLTTPNRNLGNERPIRRALTDLGARQVEDLLVKIAYGFPS
jgi:putative toxin-antitoxin system antitoxin component (TIGR02293 family)